MDVINRSAVIVMPAEPLLKWLHRASKYRYSGPKSYFWTLSDADPAGS